MITYVIRHFGAWCSASCVGTVQVTRLRTACGIIKWLEETLVCFER